ncbi:DUF533 domain-containing protein [Escherichia coli]
MGTNALLVGGGAVAVWAPWNKYKQKILARRIRTNRSLARKVRRWMSVTERLVALVFAAKSDGHIDAKERAAIDQQLREAAWRRTGVCTH